MTRPVLLLDATGPDATRLIAAANLRGHPVHAIQGSPTGQVPPLAGSLVTDLTNPGQAVADIVRYGRRIGAAAAITTNEYLTVILAETCAALGLAGNDPTRADAARNKISMAAAFAKHRVTAPTTHVVANSHELTRLATSGQVTFPCVVKPADSAGSVGVTIVDTPDGLAVAYHRARASQPGRGTRVVVQQHVRGREYSVESLTHDGATTHLCITAKTTAPGKHPVETGHSLPTALPLAVQRAVHEQVTRAITAVGICNGASHTELIIDASVRCTVIEIGARLGAGHIGDLIAHALGVDVWAAQLDIALGRRPRLDPTRGHYAAVRFLASPTPGRLRGVRGLPTAGPGIPESRLRVRVGDTVWPAQTNRCRLGYFIVTGADPTEVADRANRTLRQIHVDVEPTEADQLP